MEHHKKDEKLIGKWKFFNKIVFILTDIKCLAPKAQTITFITLNVS